MLSLNEVTFDVNGRWWRRKIGLFAMSMYLLLHGVTVWSAEVVDSSGPLYLFQVEHPDNGVEWAYEMSQFFHYPLTLGDKICILEPYDKQRIANYYSDKLYLKIKLNDGKVQTIPEGGEYKSEGLYKDRCKVKNGATDTACYCYEVKESPPLIPPTKGELFKRLLDKVFLALSNEYDEWVIGVSKGGKEKSKKVEIPMLGTDSTPAKMVAGRNTLHLAWEGSQSSYWVHVYQNGNPVQKEGFVVDKPEIILSNPDSKPFSSGQKYRVEVIGKDDPCARAEGVFEVVNDLMAVLPAEEIKIIEQAEKSPQEEKDVLIAALLIKSGAWLESYQRGLSNPFEKFLTNKDVRNKVLRKIEQPSQQP